MVAPEDVVRFAAIVMCNHVLFAIVYKITGQVEYCSNNIAQFFEGYTNREVVAQQTPCDWWIPTLTSVGFSDDPARNMALMTETVVNITIFGENLADLIVWDTDMKEYLERLK